MSDFSFGVIPVCMVNNKAEFLLIQHKSKAKHWAFPKWHKEKWETDLDAAKREFEEEVWVNSNLLRIEKWWSQATHYNFFAYWLHKTINKKVLYFLWHLEKKYSIIIQDEELLDYAWLSYEDALAKFTYDGDRALLKSAAEFLKLL